MFFLEAFLFISQFSALPARNIVGEHEGDLGPQEFHGSHTFLNGILHQDVAHPEEEMSS